MPRPVASLARLKRVIYEVRDMVMMSGETVFSQEQVEYLSSLKFINKIDEHLRIVSAIKIVPVADGYPPRVVLILEIYYDDQKIDKLSFDLHGYDYEDIVELARNIRSSEFILQEVDNLLAGDIE
jgi:hypothetical protein